MHDNKFLWRIGHSHHHKHRVPNHLMGFTNFAFDHIVESWVAMSSTFFPMMMFPINYWVSKVAGLIYLVVAVAAHFDGVPFRYHLYHHYLVTKNYCSHIPIFDILFGTYQWNDYYPKGSNPCYFPQEVKDGKHD